MNLSNITRWLKANKPSIMIYFGAACLIASGITACKATADIAEKESITKKEVIKKYGTPVVLLVGGTILTICGDKSHITKEKMLTGLYNTLAKSKDISQLGNTVLSAGTAKLSDKVFADNSGNEEKWFYDDFSQTYFKSTWREVLMSNLHAQDAINQTGFAYVSSYYAELNTPEIDFANYPENLGWLIDTLVNDYECYFVPFDYDYDDDRDGSTREKAIGIYFPITPKLEDC